MLECAPSLQSTLHNFTIAVNSTTPNVICIVLNKRYFAFTFPIAFAMVMSPQAASGLDGVSDSHQSQERSANSVFATSPLPSRGPHGGEKSIWLHYPCFLGVPMVGRNQPSKEWMRWKRAKYGRKLVKLGENPNFPYPECEGSIKIPVVKQQ